MVPGSFGCGSAVLAAMATLAPSRAARSAMARPMPRLAPVMNRVLPARLALIIVTRDNPNRLDSLSPSGAQVDAANSVAREIYHLRMPMRGQFLPPVPRALSHR